MLTNETPTTDDTNPIPPYKRSRFVRAVYLVGAAWTVVGSGACLFVGIAASVSFLLGSGVALASFWLLERMLARIYDKGGNRGAIFLLILLKYVGIGAVLTVCMKSDAVRVGYFSAGLLAIYVSVVALLVVRMTSRRAWSGNPTPVH
ncbi:MAG: hypothetical protein O3A46_16060 [Candidatus Poribacteria bacterium]|nr:hypothetical protein [Candidatus Poribacteria bacterium]